MSKLDANDLHEIQTVQTGYHPIGITYDRTTGAVWVANYGGSIQIFVAPVLIGRVGPRRWSADGQLTPVPPMPQ